MKHVIACWLAAFSIAACGENVEARKSSKKSWASYPVAAAAPAATDARFDVYGGWANCRVGKASGFFQVREVDGRWMFVDPIGNAWISKGVACLRPGGAARQKAAVDKKFGDVKNLLSHEIAFLKGIGFNSTGCWSAVDEFPKDESRRIPYTVFVSVMGSLNSRLRKAGECPSGFKHSKHGFPWDVPQVFSPEFKAVAEEKLMKAAEYASDPWCVGYFIDNEIPFSSKNLANSLTKWPKGHPVRKAAQQWLDNRLHKTGASITDASKEDCHAFVDYELETYLSTVVPLLRKYDPNHLFLGSRFNNWRNQLERRSFFRTAGRYVDVVSINHYNRWEPDQKMMADWLRWAGKPFIITEFYVKAEDSGLGNTTGAGWCVKTQRDRGLFYRNFVTGLVRSKGCVGWHWFRYQDNDPQDKTTDPSNRDSNKGIVRWDYSRYDPLVELMRETNAGIVAPRP